MRPQEYLPWQTRQAVKIFCSYEFQWRKMMKFLYFILFFVPLPGWSYDSVTIKPTGPNKVGTRTIVIDNLTTQVYYPGKTIKKNYHKFDLRSYLPDEDRHKIPDYADPNLGCECFHGIFAARTKHPKPVIILIHGTAGFSTASTNLSTDLASHGFVVLAADHPWIQLKDMLQSTVGFVLKHQIKDTQKLLKSIRNENRSLKFLGPLDIKNIGLIGHSAGVGAVRNLAHKNEITAVVAMAGNGILKTHKPKLIIGGTEDTLVKFKDQEEAYLEAPRPKALVGIEGAGHLAFTDICALMPNYGGILEAAMNFGLKVPIIIRNSGKDGCEEDNLDVVKGWAIINGIVTGFLEQIMIKKDLNEEKFRHLINQFNEIETARVDY